LTRASRTAAALIAALGLTVCLVQARGVPSRLSDGDFWRLVSEFSEPGGYFPSNNFVSNELDYQTVIPRLKESVRPGGVYLGVGPEQNFTYIAALRPAVAFIVDIRRQNMLQHLMYKALFELSETRADFLSRLFARPRPPGLADDAPVSTLIAAFSTAEPSPALFTETVVRVLELLERKRKFALTPDDADTIQFLLETFFRYGPEVTYSPVELDRPFVTVSGLRLSMFPSYGELATRTDTDGTNHGYLASEAHYAFLRDLERRNLIVPIVGDFAGARALREIGRWVTDHGAVVTAIYTSNVEQYLFQNDDWRAYYDNVARLPTDETSTFIRSFFPNRGMVRVNPAARAFTLDSAVPTNLYLYPESATLLNAVRELLAAVGADAITGYLDVIGMSK
jgi:hypothetical protein